MHKFSIACKLLNAKLFKARLPVIVSWALTYRCNRRCKYCAAWEKQSSELATKEALTLIDEISKAGVKRLHFSGGEPLLRDDIGIILKYAKDKGISAALNSNGSLVPEKIDGLTGLDVLTLSLDGPQEIHDSLRGAGSYCEVMDAVESARAKNINLRFICVFSKVNISCVDFMLKKASELKIPVFFQPSTKLLLEGAKENPVAPFGNEYTEAISRLIKEKHRNNYIANSVSGLRHLKNWPCAKEIVCVNSLIFCRIEPDGSLFGCSDFKKKDTGLNCAKTGFKNAFASLTQSNCRECWCASYVELNCLFSMKLDSILNALRLA